MADSTTDSINNFPTQAEFLAHGVIECTDDSPCPPGTQCSICTDNCGDYQTDILQLIPCSHYFHKECIQAWFTGSQPMRGTCPNCRTYLFEPDDLTATQIQQNVDFPDEQDASQVLSFVTPQVERLLTRFNTIITVQDSASEADEIIRSWTTSTRERVALGAWLHTFHRRTLDRPEDAAQFSQLVDVISGTLDAARSAYIGAMTVDLRAQFASILERLNFIRESRNTIGEQEPPEFKEVETEIDGMVARLMQSTPDELSEMQGKTWTIAIRVVHLGRKYIVVEPTEGDDSSPANQGNGETYGSNFFSEIEDIMAQVEDILAEVDQSFDNENVSI